MNIMEPILGGVVIWNLFSELYGVMHSSVNSRELSGMDEALGGMSNDRFFATYSRIMAGSDSRIKKYTRRYN